MTEKAPSTDNLFMLPSAAFINDDRSRQCQSMLKFILNSGNDNAIRGIGLSLVAYKKIITEKNDRDKVKVEFDQNIKKMKEKLAEMRGKVALIQRESGLHLLEE